MSTKDIDVLVYGATGFTGRLVVRDLLQRYADGDLAWAIAGRDQAKLEKLSTDEGLPVGTQRLVADANDLDALRQVVSRTKVVLTTAGPYAKHGSNLVAVCAELGTDYCDLTGEVYWMRRMIDAHESTARASGARIIHACGFDSVPSDVGTYFLQQTMRQRHSVPASHVKFRVREFRGGFSGGTIDSMMTMMAAAARDPSINLINADPYALNPSDAPRGPDGPDRFSPAYDSDFGVWVAPFVMSAINTRVVRRTNALLNQAYGRDFRYDEATLMRGGPFGFLGASASGLGVGGLNRVGGRPTIQSLMQRFLPSPGQGPDAASIENGFYDIEMLAKHPTESAHNLRATIHGDKDPGYGSTSKMINECAVALANGETNVGGGFWTPASALGDALLTRLPQGAGVTVKLVD